MTAARRGRESPTAEGKPVKRVSTNVTIAVIAAIVLLLYLVRQILLPFVVAGIVAYVCTPLVDLLSRRAHLPRGLAAFATGLVLAGIAAVVGWIMEPLILRELAHGAQELSDMRGFVRHWIGGSQINIFGKQWTDAEIASAITTAAQRFVARTGGIAGLLLWGFAGAFGVLLAWVLFFYFLIGGPAIARGILWLIPPLDRPLVQGIWRVLDPVLRRYFIGLAIVVIYASTAAYIGLGLILHTPHALVLAVLTGFLELIPIVGPAASAVLAGVFTIHAATGPGAILAYIAYASALRISIDQFIGPIVLGRAARTQPSIVIFCFLSGAVLFGIPGVVLAVPVALLIKVSVSVLYGETRA